MNIDKIIEKLTPEAAERLALVIVGGNGGSRAPEKPKGYLTPKFGDRAKVVSSAVTAHSIPIGTLVNVGNPTTWSGASGSVYAVYISHNGMGYTLALSELDPVE